MTIPNQDDVKINDYKVGDKLTGECDACHYGPTTLTVYRKAWPLQTEEKKALCGLCDSSMVGQIDDYRHLQYDPNAVQIQRQINYVGNAILAAIAAKAQS